MTRSLLVESSIDILVPEARRIVGEWYDETPAATGGMPPHITLLWPWIEEVDDVSLDRVSDAVKEFRAFALTFGTTGRFPGTLYLRPSPTGELAALMKRLWRSFPDTPPYGGRFEGEPVPHLTVAKGDDAKLDQIETIVSARVSDPFVVRVDRVCVSQEGAGRGDRWGVVAEFALSSKAVR